MTSLKNFKCLESEFRSGRWIPRGEYKKVRKALEFVMELIENVGEERLKRQLFEKRKEKLTAEQSHVF